MRLALEAAAQAGDAGEVPVGAVCVAGGKLLSTAGNAPITSHDPSAHAEIRALRAAALQRENYRLPGVTLYVTLEPCCMCLGAIIHARIERLVYAASDPRTGSVHSVRALLDETSHNHRVSYEGGVLAEESACLLRAFFRERRG